jgi:hypothetical protein
MIAEPVGAFSFLFDSIRDRGFREKVQATSRLTGAAGALQDIEPPIGWLLRQYTQRTLMVRRDFRGLHVPSPATASIPV